LLKPLIHRFRLGLLHNLRPFFFQFGGLRFLLPIRFQIDALCIDAQPGRHRRRRGGLGQGFDRGHFCHRLRLGRGLRRTIYHNPRCSTCRRTLALLEERGIEPKIIEYLVTPPSAEELRTILGLLGKSPRDILRKKEAKEVGLDDPALDDDALIAGMAANPIVLERPIVINDGKAALGRPPENVLEIL